MAVDPGTGRPNQLVTFPPVNRFDRIAELIAHSRLHFNERHQVVTLGYQVDVPMAGPIPTLKHGPATGFQPSLRYSLALQPELHCPF